MLRSPHYLEQVRAAMLYHKKPAKLKVFWIVLDSKICTPNLTEGNSFNRMPLYMNNRKKNRRLVQYLIFRTSFQARIIGENDWFPHEFQVRFGFRVLFRSLRRNTGARHTRCYIPKDSRPAHFACFQLCFR